MVGVAREAELWVKRFPNPSFAGILFEPEAKSEAVGGGPPRTSEPFGLRINPSTRRAGLRIKWSG